MKNLKLKSYLQGTLNELNKLSDQIRETQDYSQQAEAILCLREFVLEQLEGSLSENSRSTNNAIR